MVKEKEDQNLKHLNVNFYAYNKWVHIHVSGIISVRSRTLGAFSTFNLEITASPAREPSQALATLLSAVEEEVYEPCQEQVSP